MEEYVDINGFSQYEVSSYGKIKNKKTGRVLSENVNEKGYMKISINGDDGKRHTLKMHRVVCEHFNPNPGRLPQVDHKDEDKSNNRADNLRWCTHSQNQDWHYKKHSKGKYNLDRVIPEPRNETCISINGDIFESITLAGRYIADLESRNYRTVSKEISKMVHGKRAFGTMYGKYEIGEVG